MRFFHGAAASETETDAERLSPCAAPARNRPPRRRAGRPLGRRLARWRGHRPADGHSADAAGDRLGADADAPGHEPRPSASTASRCPARAAATGGPTATAAAGARRDDSLTRARDSEAEDERDAESQGAEASSPHGADAAATSSGLTARADAR